MIADVRDTMGLFLDQLDDKKRIIRSLRFIVIGILGVVSWNLLIVSESFLIYEFTEIQKILQDLSSMNTLALIAWVFLIVCSIKVFNIFMKNLILFNPYYLYHTSHLFLNTNAIVKFQRSLYQNLRYSRARLKVYFHEKAIEGEISEDGEKSTENLVSYTQLLDLVLAFTILLLCISSYYNGVVKYVVLCAFMTLIGVYFYLIINLSIRYMHHIALMPVASVSKINDKGFSIAKSETLSKKQPTNNTPPASSK